MSQHTLECIRSRCRQGRECSSQQYQTAFVELTNSTHTASSEGGRPDRRVFDSERVSEYRSLFRSPRRRRWDVWCRDGSNDAGTSSDSPTHVRRAPWYPTNIGSLRRRFARVLVQLSGTQGMERELLDFLATNAINYAQTGTFDVSPPPPMNMLG